MSDEMRRAFEEWAKDRGFSTGEMYGARAGFAAAWTHRPAVSVVPGVDLDDLQRYDEYDFGLGKNPWGEWVRFSEVTALLTTAQAPVSSGKCNRRAQCAKGWGGKCYGSTPCEDRVTAQAPVSGVGDSMADSVKMAMMDAMFVVARENAISEGADPDDARGHGLSSYDFNAVSERALPSILAILNTAQGEVKPDPKCPDCDGTGLDWEEMNGAPCPTCCKPATTDSAKVREAVEKELKKARRSLKASRYGSGVADAIASIDQALADLGEGGGR